MTADEPVGEVKGLLAQDLDRDLQFHRVSRDVKATRVNSSRNDQPAMVEPVNSL